MRRVYITKLFPHGIPPNRRFVRIVDRQYNEISYDLVPSHHVAKHLSNLHKAGFEAHVITRNCVPPCAFRNYNRKLRYCYGDSLNGGTEYFFPIEGEEKVKL